VALLPPALEALIEALTELPGIGRKSAERIAYHLLAAAEDEALGLARAIETLKRQMRFCSVCNNLAQGELCPVCTDARRDRASICVVERPTDVPLVEKTGYRGLYHVLLGTIDPLEGVGPAGLAVEPLLKRVREGTGKGSVREVIIATDPDAQGETTAAYLAEALKGAGVKVTRLARGVPVGSSLEFVDEVTLGKALEGRREL